MLARPYHSWAACRIEHLKTGANALDSTLQIADLSERPASIHQRTAHKMVVACRSELSGGGLE